VFCVLLCEFPGTGKRSKEEVGERVNHVIVHTPVQMRSARHIPPSPFGIFLLCVKKESFFAGRASPREHDVFTIRQAERGKDRQCFGSNNCAIDCDSGRFRKSPPGPSETKMHPALTFRSSIMRPLNPPFSYFYFHLTRPCPPTALSSIYLENDIHY
jgi:hypothetical protein